MENAQDFNFSREISQLISLHQEGEFWDFKKQWYTNKADMLHDIICMANNLCNHTAYIIVGIDEEHNYSICDVSADPNRKNTQKIVDFLKDKKFAGGIRPVVYVENLVYDCANIDVIIIKNSCNTPFYLTTQFEKLRANNIYTRVMDTNTPVDGSADINHVEQLWRKRFHLDDTPIEKLCFYLKNPNDWECIQDCDMGYFYKYSPEYTIICEKDDSITGYEYYIFGQVDTQPSWWWITLKYHQTAIEKFQGLALDGGRSFVVAPQRADDVFKMGISNFGFFIQNELRYQLLMFYQHKETSEKYSFNKYMSAVMLFRSEYEYKTFLDYLRGHKSEYDEIYNCVDKSQLPIFPEIPGYNMDVFVKNCKDTIVMQKMLETFRNQIDTMEATHAHT